MIRALQPVQAPSAFASRSFGPVIAGRGNILPFPNRLPTPTPLNPVGYQVSPLSAPVPTGTPTDEIFTDASGNEWQYNPQTAEWVQITSASGLPAAPATVAVPGASPYENYYSSAADITGSSVALPPGMPAGYPTDEIFTDASGEEWQFENGQWVMISSGASGSTLTASATISTSWFDESTLFPGLSNGLVLGGGLAGLLVMFMLTRKR